MNQQTRRRTDDFDDDAFETIIGHDGKPARVLRDGAKFRVPLAMRDSVSSLDASRPLVVDARGIGGTEGNKPGWRVLACDYGRREKAEAYNSYEEALTTAYKLPSASTTPTDVRKHAQWLAEPPEGERYRRTTPPHDSRSVEQVAADHRRNMTRIYADTDAALSRAWRCGK
jgi:hypothetical protein